MNIIMHILKNVTYIQKNMMHILTYYNNAHEHNNAHFTERFIRFIQNEHNDAHLTKRFV